MAENSRTKNSLINLIIGFGGHFLSLLLQFIVRTVFIKTLGASYLGINGLFSNILSMLSLAELGIGSAIGYRLYKPLAEHDEQRIRVLFKFYKWAYKLIGAAILALGFLIIPFLPVFIKDYDRLATLNINAVFLFLLFLSQTVSSYFFLAYRRTIISADQKRYINDSVAAVTSIVRSIVQIVILLVFRDFILYTVVAIAASIASSLIIGLIAKKKYPRYFLREKESLSKHEVIDMLKDCGALFVNKVNGVILKASDNLVLSSFIGIVVVGAYSNYLLLHRTIVALVDKVFAAFKSSMGNLFAVESMETKYRFFRFLCFLTSLLYGTAGVGIAVCANEFVHNWIGADFILQQPIPILIGIEIYFAGIVTNLSMTRSVSGVFRQAWYRPLLGSVVNIIVSIALVKPLGIAGVILGTISTYVFSYYLLEPSLIYKHTFKHYKSVLDYYKTNLLYLVIILIVATADMWICNHLFTGHGWFSVAVHVLITGISIPAVFALLFWKTEECRYLVNLISRTFNKVFKRR